MVEPPRTPAPPERPWRTFAVLLAAYILATLLTMLWLVGDTVDYAVEAVRFDRHGWEFGHLWWVPLGWALRALTGVEDKGGVIRLLVAVNAVAGLACVLLLRGFLGRAGLRPLVSTAAALAFLFSHGFLTYTQTGCSYVPGLAFLMLAFFLALDPRCRGWTSLASGLALGAAICFWFPYVLAVPGVLLAPLLLPPPRAGEEQPPGRQQVWFVVRLALGLGLCVGLAYGMALLALDVHDVVGFRQWMARSSHGVTTRGVGRMVFGLARSFLAMGEDGVLFKRFLLKDPYNPVTLADLLRLSLWKFLFFYLALAAVGLNLLAGSARGRRLLLLVLAGALPVLVFAAFWQGGDPERYFPLYPLFFLAAGGALCPSTSGWAWPRWLLGIFFVVMALVNGLNLATWEVEGYQRRLVGRVEEVRAKLTPGSRLFVTRDRLSQLSRDFTLDPPVDLEVAEVAVPGLASTPRWRQEFAALAGATWKEGGDVWLSKRLFEERPRAEGLWVEGDDSRLRWAELPAFFGSLQTADDIGGPDGFVRLPPTPGNRQVLEAVED